MNTARSHTTRESAVIALLAFALYAAGACPTIYVGDSGELVTAVATLGIPHPSGYPLYVLLGKLWTLLLPLGSIAWRMSMFSALCAALAVGGLHYCARRLGLGRPAALLAAFTMACGGSLWSQANIQRVYALNALLLVAALILATRWWANRRMGTLALAFFVCGLGASNHSYMALFAIALSITALASEPALLASSAVALRGLARCGSAFMLGLLPYVYLPIRASMYPVLDWGEPRTVGGFLDVTLRRGFWQRAWIEQPSDLVAVAFNFAATLGDEITWPGAALALIGLFAAGMGRNRGEQREPTALLPLLVSLAVFGNVAVLAAHGSRSDIFIWHRYYIPSYVLLALLAGVGWQFVSRWLPRAAGWLVLALPLWLLVIGISRFDRSGYALAEDFAGMVLDSVSPGAHLIATDDNILFSLMYLHWVERRRPDVDLIMQGVDGATPPALRFDPDNDPLFLTHYPNWHMPALEVVPIGVVFRACRRDRPLPSASLPARPLAGEHDPAVPKDYLTQNLIGHYHYMRGFSLERVAWPQAASELESAARAAPDNDVLFYNLGLIYARNGWYREALAAFGRSNQINPRHLAGSKRARALDRIVEARAERDRIALIKGAFSQDASDLAAPDSAAFHLRMADFLDARGERTAARGQRLRAATISSDRSKAPAPQLGAKDREDSR